MDTEELKARIDARTFYQSVVGTGKRSGKALLDHVPWRVDRHPSLNVYADGWVDKASGKGGDIFSLVQHLYQMSFPQSVQFVETWFGDPSDTSKRQCPARVQQDKETDNTQPPDAAAQRKARQIMEQGIQALWSPEGQAALDDLHRRGLNDETIRAAQLGCASANTMDRLFHGKYGRSDAIIIPWIRGSNIWAVKFRRLTPGDEEAKYVQLSGMNLAGTVYSLGPLRPDKPTFILEGEFKVLYAQQVAGDLANFITTGSARNRIHKRYLCLIGSCPMCIQVPDQDSTGRNAAEENALGLPDGYIIAAVPQTLGYAKSLDDFAALGGDVRAFILKTLSDPTREPENGSWSGGLPMSYRATLRLYTPDSIAPYMELRCEAIALGWVTADQEVTIAELLDLAARTGREVSEDTLRRAATWLAENLAILPPEDSLPKENQESLKGKTAKQPGRAKRYPMPSRDQIRDILLKITAKRLLEDAFPNDDSTIAPIADLLDDAPDMVTFLEQKYGDLIEAQPDLRRKLDQVQRAYRRVAWRLADLTTVPLPAGWTYRNRSEHVACCARAIKAANPDEDLSHYQWSVRLGISPRLVPRVLKQAGIRSIPVYEDVVIGSVPQARQLGYSMQAYPRQIIAVDGHTSVYSPEVLEQEIVRSGQVTVRFQKVNHQELVGDAQPAPLQAARAQSSQAARSGRSDRTTVSRSGASPGVPYYGLDHDPVWRENGRLKLLSQVTSWTRRGDSLLDRTTGVLRPYSPQTVLELLIQANVPASASTGDALLDLVTDGLSGIILSIEESGCWRVASPENAVAVT